MTGSSFAAVRLGRVAYADAFALQRRLVDARVAGEIEDVLLLLEPPPTITHSHTGRGLENLIGGATALDARGVVVEPTDRGGNITFHGPGQLVGYPIVALHPEGERDLHLHLRRLEDVLIRAAERFSVSTARVPGRTGTWLPDGSRKLAAIGVKVRRWTTFHGFALNVRTDLSFFDLIVPCGIADAGVTSLEHELGATSPSLDDVMDAVEAEFASVFDRRLSPPSDALRILLRTSAAAVDPG